MTIQFNNLTVEADVQSEHYDILSILDNSGREVNTTPSLLDEIEARIEETLEAERYETDYWNCEMPHLLMHIY